MVTAVGALGTLGVATAMGMPPGDVAHIGLFLLPAAVVTVVSGLAARRLLARSPIRHRLTAVALLGAVVGLGNLAVVAQLTFVSDHDASVVGALLAYSAGAGLAAALVTAKASAATVERLADAARRLGQGDLQARVGAVEGEAELATLGRTLDEMADRLRASLARERELEARRRDLITAASHDLRTPLSSLQAMVEAIDEGVVEDLPSLRRYVREMRRSVESLVALVDDLFELAQLDAGIIEYETKRARLREVVDQALAACHRHVVEKGVVVHQELNGMEDQLCSPRLTRVVQNLLVNAIRHTPADGTVRLETSRSRAGLELVVEDTGEGMTPEVLERVFEPFWREDPARSGGGAGLGLALTKRIVEALGGRIEAESQPARGSRFAVSLPA